MQRPRPIPPLLMRSARFFALAFVLTAWLSGCAGDGAPSRPENSLLADAPDWILVDCSQFWSGRAGARLCGVGSVAGTRNLSLAKTAAIGRARIQISAMLEPMVEGMLRDYSAAGRAEDAATGALSEQQIANITTQITEFTAQNGTTLRVTWVAPDGTLYALVDLDVEHFETAVDQMSSLTDSIRSGVRERAAKAFQAAGQATTSAPSSQ